MAVGATRTQKAKVLQLAIDRFADQRTGGPGHLHVVVVPGFSTVKSQTGRFLDQGFMPQAVTGRVGQNRQTTGRMDGLHDGIRPQRFPCCGIASVVGTQCRVIQLETQGEHMDQTAFEQSTDFHSAPKGRNGSTLELLLLQPGPHGGMGMGTVVIRHGEMVQTPTGGLLDQRNRVEAAVTAKGVAVEVERSRTTSGVDLLQNRSKRVIHIRLLQRLQLSVSANAHRTESRQP